MTTTILLIALSILTSMLAVILLAAKKLRKNRVMVYKQTTIAIICHSLILLSTIAFEDQTYLIIFKNALPVASILIFRYMHLEFSRQYELNIKIAIEDIVIRVIPYIYTFLMVLSTFQTFVNNEASINPIGAFDTLVVYGVVLYQLLIILDLFFANFRLKKKYSDRFNHVFFMNILGIIIYGVILVANMVLGTLESNILVSGIIYCVIGGFLYSSYVEKSYLEDKNQMVKSEVAEAVSKPVIQAVSYDHLTGFYTREYLNRNLNNMDTLSQDFSLIVMRMSGLKLINESFGYEQGDEILQEVSSILSEIFTHSKIARLSGSQFVLLQDNFTQEEIIDRLEIIENICKDRDGFVVNVNYGLSMRKGQDIPIEILLRRAESNLYYNKTMDNIRHQNDLADALWKNFGKLLPSLSAHLKRCSEMAVDFAMYLKLSKKETTDVRNAALLHDIALTIMPKIVKYKVDFEDKHEEKLYKCHSSKGYDIAIEAGMNPRVTNAVLFHHEHVDGTGYPYGLLGKEICQVSQIVAMVDLVDMLIHYGRDVEGLENKLISKIGIEFSEEIVYNMIDFLKDRKIIKENS